MARAKGLNFRRRRKKMSLSTAKSGVIFGLELVIVVIIAAVLVYFAGMKVTVVGNSMGTPLPDGCQILVNRFTYNLSDPKTGDVVVFLPNGNVKSHHYVKRVVGVPGDKVQIRDGILYVNGETFDNEDTEIIKNPGIAAEEITVKDGEFFVLGDNRNSSEDSRYANIGNVKKEYITGKAWLIVRPFKKLGRVR